VYSVAQNYNSIAGPNQDGAETTIRSSLQGQEADEYYFLLNMVPTNLSAVVGPDMLSPQQQA
jgi:hypothetical protein